MRCGGVITFPHLSSDKRYFHIVVTMACHRVAAFEEVWLNDEQVTPPAGSRAVRVTLDVVAGANRTSAAFAAPSGVGLGTQYATETVAGNTAIFNSTAVLGIGSADGATSEGFAGRITRAQVRNLIDGTIVANPDFRNLAPGTTSFVDSAGLTWTVQGTARVR